jgi:hypothetical protein
MSLFSLNSPLVKLTPTSGANSSGLLPVGLRSSVRIVNAGPDGAFVRSSSGATTTSVVDTCTYMLPNSSEVFQVAPNDASIAAICPSSGSATLYVQNGTGE